MCLSVCELDSQASKVAISVQVTLLWGHVSTVWVSSFIGFSLLVADCATPLPYSSAITRMPALLGVQ